MVINWSSAALNQAIWFAVPQDIVHPLHTVHPVAEEKSQLVTIDDDVNSQRLESLLSKIHL